MYSPVTSFYENIDYQQEDQQKKNFKKYENYTRKIIRYTNFNKTL